MTRTLAWLALALALALLLEARPSTALAQEEDVAERRVGVRWADGAPEVTFSARDLLHGDVGDNLRSGLAQTLAMRIYAFEEGSTQPVAVAVRSCRVVYDLWEESYRVEVSSGTSETTERAEDVDEVVQTCLVARNERVGDASAYDAGSRIWFAALVELNPLDDETVRSIRRWLARPGGRRTGGAFFGSFVSLFVNRRIGDAERTVRFRSQRVGVPP